MIRAAFIALAFLAILAIGMLAIFAIPDENGCEAQPLVHGVAAKCPELPE